MPLDGTLENKGLSQVTATNSGATVNTAGKIGSCYQFSTSNSGKLNLPADEFKTYSEISVALWLKIDS